MKKKDLKIREKIIELDEKRAEDLNKILKNWQRYGIKSYKHAVGLVKIMIKLVERN